MHSSNKCGQPSEEKKKIQSKAQFKKLQPSMSTRKVGFLCSQLGDKACTLAYKLGA